MNLLEELYNTVNTQEKATNVFENTPEKEIYYKLFARKYIDIISDIEKNGDMNNDFWRAINEARQVAFKVGFQTAVKLAAEAMNL